MSDGSPAQAAVGRNVELTADDGLDLRLFCLLVELDDAVQGAVVGDGQAVHAQFLGAGDQLRDTAHAVEQAVLGVDVEMGEHDYGYSKVGKPKTIISSGRGLRPSRTSPAEGSPFAEVEAGLNLSPPDAVLRGQRRSWRSPESG